METSTLAEGLAICLLSIYGVIATKLFELNKKMESEEPTYCHYSGLPDPSAYETTKTDEK